MLAQPSLVTADLLSYEGFEDAGLGESSGSGFANGEVWGFSQGAGSATYDILGLTYTDTQGNRLASGGGAVTVNSSAGESRYSRTFETAIAPGGRVDYWISFLVRLDSAAAGDFFWSPDGAWDIGAVGFQGGATARLVNGPNSTISAAQGDTLFIVLNLKEDTLADVWVNPADLSNPGVPDIVDGILPDSNTPQGATSALFKLNSFNSGVYTVDEFRYGQSFADVAPAIAGDDPSILVQDQITPDLGQQPSSFEVVVRNPGSTQNLEVSAVNFSGGQAGLLSLDSALPLIVAPGAEALLQFGFIPSGHTGSVDAVAEIVSNAALTPSVNLAISGFVSDPLIVVPASVTIPAIVEGSTATNVPISLSNQGLTQSLEISAVTLSGEDANLFSIVSALPITLAPGASTDLVLAIDSTISIGTIIAAAEITSNDLGSPMVTVDLNGRINQADPKAFVSDGFSDSSFSGASGSGFAAGAIWTSGIGFTYASTGLDYEDGSGNKLATSGGALMIPAGGGGNLSRELAEPIPAGGDPDYWISFLIRVDGDLATTGDAFWSSDGIFDRGAVGFQGNATANQIRLVNGASTGVVINGGETALVVINLKSNSVIDVWVNPDLSAPGVPTLQDAAVSGGIPLANAAVFKFNTEGTAGYTIDEFRYGIDFSAVAPIGNDVDQGLAITSFRLVNGEMILTWRSNPDTQYIIEDSPDLKGWNEIDDPVGAAGSTETSVNLGIPPVGFIENFYRVSELP